MNKLLIYLGIFLIALLVTGISCAKDADKDTLPVNTTICTFVGVINSNIVYIAGNDVPAGCFANVTVENKIRLNGVDYLIDAKIEYALSIMGIPEQGAYTVEIIL